jgi:GNAT superfamily N-acetyltransferase
MVYKENILKYDDYYELRKSVGWSNFSKEQAMKALKNSQYDVVVFENNQPIGMGRLVGDGIYYTVVDVVIKPEHQGKGIGSKVINMILDYATNATPIGGRTSVQLIAVKGKEMFYEKMGFKKIPHENCGSGMRMIIYNGEQ